MAMTRKDIPAYFKWRGGRPRWEPGPTIRARGFKGRDLKDASGAWLSRGMAIDEAEGLNAAVRGAPAAELPRPAYTRTFAELVVALKATRKFRLELDDSHKGHKKRRIKKHTRDQYLIHLRIITAWCGDLPVAGLRPKQIEDFYDALIETRGLPMANAVMRTFRLALNFAKDTLEWVDRNRAAQVELEEADGRRVLWSMEEIAAFIAFADAMLLPEFGDALILGALTGLRQADLLASPRFNLDGDTLTVTSKTGRAAKFPAIRQARLRILAARARLSAAAPNVVHRTEIVATDRLRPYTDGSLFRTRFRMIRWAAAGGLHALAAAGAAEIPATIAGLAPAPALIDKQWADLRDTSVTWLLLAGCNPAEIATIQGRSLASVTTIIDKHYFVRDDAFARAGGNKLEIFLDQANVKW